MKKRIKYPNDNYKYVIEVMIKVLPARFNPNQITEKMVLTYPLCCWLVIIAMVMIKRL